jgi:uracil-DNA glycosylase family 4
VPNVASEVVDQTQPERRLADLGRRIVDCEACPRLVGWRHEAAANPPARWASDDYWARPLPGFGDPAARLVLVGLAPAAHGGNRTGRMFTGDRSGDFLYAALHRAGYANQAESNGRDDGLQLRDAYVTAAVRCAPPGNRPTPQERDECGSFLAEELAELTETRVVVALGGFALEALGRLGLLVGGKARFAHGAEAEMTGGRRLVCSYHPSQRNVFTGLLTAAMFDDVLARAASLAARAGG